MCKYGGSGIGRCWKETRLQWISDVSVFGVQSSNPFRVFGGSGERNGPIFYCGGCKGQPYCSLWCLTASVLAQE